MRNRSVGQFNFGLYLQMEYHQCNMHCNEERLGGGYHSIIEGVGIAVAACWFRKLWSEPEFDDVMPFEPALSDADVPRGSSIADGPPPCRFNSSIASLTSPPT